MAEIKMTKQSLRQQQQRLLELQKYLPTLQLKKAMLQAQVQEARADIERQQERFAALYAEIASYSALLSADAGIDVAELARITELRRGYENSAGVEVPYLKEVDFAPYTYSLLDTPPWLDAAAAALRQLAKEHAALHVAREKEHVLAEELRAVAIRVNLFEKILIPRAQRYIKQIKVFLGDQQLAAIGRAKVAKQKMTLRR